MNIRYWKHIAPYVDFEGICIKCYGETNEVYAVETYDIFCTCFNCGYTYIFMENGEYLYLQEKEQIISRKYTINSDGTLRFIS